MKALLAHAAKPARLLPLFVLLISLTPGLLAQENYGSIFGTVKDATGGAVPGANLEASSPAMPQPLKTTSDASGNFAFPRLPIGTYAISTAKEGFQTVRQQGILVQLGSQITYNPSLTVGQVTQVIEVSESAVSIDPTSSRTATNITATQIDSLAKGRTFNSILGMAPGARSEVKGGSAGVGGISVDGASGSENVFVIDGVDVSNVRRGALDQASALPMEQVGEVQVKSGGFEAEYGGATGGVINVVTKGGTNEFHGQGYFQFTNSGTNAGDRAFYQRSPLDANATDFFRPKEDDYHIYYPGFSIGGPMIRNRLFFFGNLSPEQEKTTRNIAYSTGARTFEQKYTRWYGLGRVDYQPTSKLQLNTSYFWSPTKQTGFLQNRDPRVAAPSDDLSIKGGYRPAQGVSISGTYSATAKLVLSARYGYRYYNDKLGNYGLSGDPYVSWGQSSVGLAGVPAAFQQRNGFTNVANTLSTQRDILTRNNLYLDGTYIAGRHTLKFGYQTNRLHNDIETDYTNGRFILNWGQSFNRGSIRNATGTYGYYVWEDGVRNKGNVESNNQAYFFQDAWRVNNRLTLNLGLRMESEFLPPFISEVKPGVVTKRPVSFGWGDKIAPRIGAAYDLLGDGKWKVSGSFGLFYDTLKYELARGAFGSDYWFTHVYPLNNPNVLGAGLTKANPGALAGGAAKFIQYDNRSLPFNDDGSAQGVDPDIKPYMSREFTGTIEHALTNKMTFSARYTHKGLLRAIEDIGVLDAEDNEVYLIGNPGFGQTRKDPLKTYDGKTPNGQEFLVPKAVRKYDAVEFRLAGQGRNHFYIASYTWSRLWGNYSGSANSDESGRSDPGVSRAFDLPYYYFDATGSQKNVFGRLGTDRPHTFKLFGSYDVNVKNFGKSTFGLNQIAYSGTPDSTSVIYLSAPTYPYGRADMGRTPVLTQTDLSYMHTFSFNERYKARFEVNIINLWNQAAPIARVSQLNRAGAITIDPVDFFKGYDPNRFVIRNSPSIPYNPIYGLPGASYRAGGGPGVGLSSAFSATFPNFGAYQEFRTIRMGVRFFF